MKEYIEREAVLERLAKVDMDTYYGFTAAVQFGVNHAIQCIKEAPAADVAEVRHGRWIEDERTYPGPGLKNNLCSACGEVAGAWKEGLEPGRKWAYCPNCGARMGKEDEHEAD